MPDSRDCSRCGKPIPSARLIALPHVTLCVPCKEQVGDDPPRIGHMVFSHKTAGEIEIISQSALRALTRLDRRGYKRSVK